MDPDQDFGNYVAARWASLVRAGVVLGCSVEDAEDLAQTSLLRCYTKWSHIRRARDPDAYVYRILINCHRDIRRRAWWGERSTADVPEPNLARDRFDSVEDTDTLRRALDSLSCDHREVVVLRYLNDFSEERTARILKIPPGTVKSRLSRAISKLAESDSLQQLRNETQ